MKLFLKITLFLLLITTMVNSCKRDEFSNLTKTHHPQIDYFPNEIGYEWKYSYYDSVAMVSDTVKVKIVGQTILSNGQQAFIWQFNYAHNIDTNYVFKIGDTIKIYEKYFAPNISKMYCKDAYILPLSVGQYWTPPYYGVDTTKVISEVNCIVSPGVLQDGFYIYREAHGLNYFLREKNWFVPQIGLVKMKKNIYDFNYINENWQLISYNFPQ
jgi:hypothetical protein